MKIRYKISTLVIILTVAIILLINLSYVKILTCAADELIARYLRRQMTSILVNVPPEDEIDWGDMQSQADRALSESEDLLYIAVYNADNNEIRLMSINVERIRSLTDDGTVVRSSEIVEGLGRGDLDIKEAREIDILAQSDPPSTSLRVVIGYTFPISGQMSSFILWIALILVVVFTVLEEAGRAPADSYCVLAQRLCGEKRIERCYFKHFTRRNVQPLCNVAHDILGEVQTPVLHFLQNSHQTSAFSVASQDLLNDSIHYYYLLADKQLSGDSERGTFLICCEPLAFLD